MPGGGEAPAVVCGRVIVDEHEGVGEDHNAAEQEPAHELEKYIQIESQINCLFLTCLNYSSKIIIKSIGVHPREIILKTCQYEKSPL